MTIWDFLTNFALVSQQRRNMRHYYKKAEQDYLTFDNDNVVIVDEIQQLPQNGIYELNHLLLIICFFGRYFKKNTGLTPNEYRKKYHQ